MNSSSEVLRIYIVRHGVTAWNREMRMQGHTDVALHEDGIAQAERLALRLKMSARPPEYIYSSDLARARDTAAAIARSLDLMVQTSQALRETRLGEWEGLTRTEIEARGDAELLANYLRDSHLHRPPGGETLEAVWERMNGVLDTIRRDHSGGSVAVVGHGGSLRALLCAALDAPITSMRHLWLDNASLSIIEESGSLNQRHRRVTLVNDTSHLI